MASCDTCRAPGSCCRGFVLNIGRVPEETWREDAQAILDRHKLPFVPRGVSLRFDAQPGSVALEFDCPWLGSDGRCTNYDERPNACRSFEAGSDALCAEYVHTFKGIPIVVA